MRFDRVKEVSILIPGWKDPRHLKLADVLTVDLLKCGILRRVFSSSIVTPRCVALTSAGANLQAKDEASEQ